MRTKILAAAVVAVICWINPAVRGEAVDRSFAVVVSKSTLADPSWKPVVDALIARHGGSVLSYDGKIAGVLEQLKQARPRYAAFVATPAEAGRGFVVDVSRVTRKLNDDPYGDVIWGIVTGYTPADALRIASVKDPLVIRKGGAGTSIDMSAFESGKWFSESKAGEITLKQAGKDVEKQTGPVDSTKGMAEFLNTENPDLFVTSGHASERNWLLGYKYKNGQFCVKDGQMFGQDLAKTKYPIHSTNPKVFLAIGNCLMGHIDQPDCMALGWMGSGGVDQFVGYTVVTWYGAMGWGVNSYLFDHPGEYDLAESFYFSNQCVLHDIATKYPKSVNVEIDFPESDKGNPDKTMEDFETSLAGKAGPLDPKDTKMNNFGLMWDRDVVAFYGDPLWDARLASHGAKITTDVTHEGNAYLFTAISTEDTKLQKPLAMLLPGRVKNIRVTGGESLKPLVTENFVMLFGLPKMEAGRKYEVRFTADELTTAIAER